MVVDKFNKRKSELYFMLTDFKELYTEMVKAVSCCTSEDELDALMHVFNKLGKELM